MARRLNFLSIVREIAFLVALVCFSFSFPFFLAFYVHFLVNLLRGADGIPVLQYYNFSHYVRVSKHGKISAMFSSSTLSKCV